MGYGDIGALLKGATKSFDAGRDYSLAVAQAKQAASVRQQQLELQRQQQTFREEASLQARKLILDQFQFDKDVQEQKRKDIEQKESDVKELAGLNAPDITGTNPSGRAVTAALPESQRRKGALEAKLFPEILKPTPAGSISVDALRSQVLQNPSEFPKELVNFVFNRKQAPDARSKAVTAFGAYSRSIDSIVSSNAIAKISGEEPRPIPTFKQFLDEAFEGFGITKASGRAKLTKQEQDLVNQIKDELSAKGKNANIDFEGIAGENPNINIDNIKRALGR